MEWCTDVVALTCKCSDSMQQPEPESDNKPGRQHCWTSLPTAPEWKLKKENQWTSQTVAWGAWCIWLAPVTWKWAKVIIFWVKGIKPRSPIPILRSLILCHLSQVLGPGPSHLLKMRNHGIKVKFPYTDS